MDRESDMFKVLYQSVQNSQSEIHTNQMEVQVRGIYEIYKPSEKLKYTPFETKMHNKFLLWQGIKTQSLASVLRDGVRTPAVEAAMTGYMFGKGMYFTDCFSKAAV